MPRFAIAAIAILLGALTPAQAGIVVTVDKSAQRLSVVVDGAQRYQWPVSTARMGYRTPNGTYHPQRLARKWFSREYDWSPMPYSIFFNEGYAIHGSYEISRLGRPASHGCIRLHPDNAALLFALVKERVDDTTIVVTGERPEKKAGRMRVRDEERSERHRAHRVRHAHRAVPREAAVQEEPAPTEHPNFFSPLPGSSFHPR
jgi:L,D-transpeptidase catalytic domain